MKNLIYCCIIAVSNRNHFNNGYLVFYNFSTNYLNKVRHNINLTYTFFKCLKFQN